MNKLAITLAFMIVASICVNAYANNISAPQGCVTYNPATNTYTVDPSGSVSHGKTTHHKKTKKEKK